MNDVNLNSKYILGNKKLFLNTIICQNIFRVIGNDERENKTNVKLKINRKNIKKLISAEKQQDEARHYNTRRRYKTPSPQLLRVRREAANARERRRMNNLNVAFEQVFVIYN